MGNYSINEIRKKLLEPAIRERKFSASEFQIATGSADKPSFEIMYRTTRKGNYFKVSNLIDDETKKIGTVLSFKPAVNGESIFSFGKKVDSSSALTIHFKKWLDTLER